MVTQPGRLATAVLLIWAAVTVAWCDTVIEARVAGLVRTLPRRAPLTGRGLPSKLGLLYLMGDAESAGFFRLAESGYVPIVKTCESCADRGWAVKRHNPRAVWVVGVGVSLDAKKQTPREAAEAVYRHVSERFAKVPAEMRARVDFLGVAPNMWEPKSVEDARWYSEYLCELLPHARAWGPRPVVLNSGVGGLPVGDNPAVLDAMAPGLRLAHHLGGAWACHGYTLDYSKDAEHESWYSLRYRRAYDHFRTHHPDLMTFPMILLEGGVDKAGDPDKDGYLARGDLRRFADWLAWYDREIMKDDQVLGVTLFKIGSPGTWKSFDLEPMTPWLFEHHRGARASRARQGAAELGRGLLGAESGR